eukprot:NODE_27196_length_522_cov_1.437975.p2 GENE.NODE_27196_length_522_cov_1.437975~~NODE_27196_length_522_cov_1.437975.p2  ORF type:complete len:103 (+),score=28.81 NODE_27196_length_522_cov_1.437975:107-415(+)
MRSAMAALVPCSCLLVAAAGMEVDYEGAAEAFHAGNALLREGSLAGAEAAFRRAAALNPSDPAFFVNLGAVLFRAGRAAEAEEMCRQAVAVAPHMALSLIHT